MPANGEILSGDRTLAGGSLLFMNSYQPILNDLNDFTEWIPGSFKKRFSPTSMDVIENTYITGYLRAYL
jgi:hypothetical protein